MQSPVCLNINNDITRVDEILEDPLMLSLSSRLHGDIPVTSVTLKTLPLKGPTRMRRTELGGKQNFLIASFR
jgi:hypothetical protein